MPISTTRLRPGMAWLFFLTVTVFILCNFCGVAAAKDGDAARKPGGKTSTALEFKIADATVPPGGIYQLQLRLTEPKPMGMGSSGFMFSASAFSGEVGAAINSPSGQAAGVALPTASGLQVAFISPDATLGTAEYPIITIALQVRADAPPGLQTPVSLDLANSSFLNAAGQPLAATAKPGTLTVGGTLNVSNILPGGSTVPAGSPISILGTGFTPSTVVQVEEAHVVTTQFISSGELDITLGTTILLGRVRVRVNTGTELVTFYPYLRAAEIGQGGTALLLNADPMFSQVMYTGASLPWISGSTIFTGLSLQNPGSNPAEVTLQLLSSTNNVLQTLSFPLPGKSKMTRDLVDFFGQPPGSGSKVVIQSTQPIQLLGLQGDTSNSTLVPRIVSVP